MDTTSKHSSSVAFQILLHEGKTLPAVVNENSEHFKDCALFTQIKINTTKITL